MKSYLAAAVLVATALAAPTPDVVPVIVAACTFSPFESANLLHGHDVNSGKIKFGNQILDLGIAFNGNKCSPAWAVGGAITDSTPTVYTGTQKQLSPAELAGLLGPLTGNGSGGALSGLLGAFGGASGKGTEGDLSSLLGVFGGGAAGAAGAPATGDLASLLGGLY